MIVVVSFFPVLFGMLHTLLELIRGRVLRRGGGGGGRGGLRSGFNTITYICNIQEVGLIHIYIQEVGLIHIYIQEVGLIHIYIQEVGLIHICLPR
jgi:hypothetical protein